MLPLPITKFDVEALIDAQLTREEEKQVWRALVGDPALNTHYRQIAAQKQLIIAWWRADAAQ